MAVRSNRRPYEKMVAIILQMLAEKPECWFSSKEIAARVIEGTMASTNAKGVTTTLEVLYITGRVERDYRGLNYRHKKYDASAADSEAMKTMQEMFERTTDALKAGYEAEIVKHNEALKQAMMKLQEADTAMKEANERAKAAEGQVREVRLKDAKGKIVKKTKGVFHKKFGRLLKLVEMRENIYLYGPAGTGKTTIAKQLAEATGLDFGFVSCTNGMSESVFTGSFLPAGTGGKFEWIPSEYPRLYENGGLFCVEEFDACDPNSALILNTSTSGDLLSLPKRRAKPYAKKHPNFVFVATCNTVGTGGDRVYTGRNKIDVSTLDRFIKIYIDYDPNLETILCPDDKLRLRCWAVRKAINDHRLERIMSTRFIQKAYTLVTEAGWTHDDLFEDAHDGFFAGWREDEINKVRNEMRQFT